MNRLIAVGYFGFPPLGAVIMGALAWIVPFLVRYILVGLGIGAVTFVGTNTAMDVLYAQVQSSFSGLPANAAALLAIAQVDTAVSLVCSAWLGRIAVRATFFATKVVFLRNLLQQ